MKIIKKIIKILFLFVVLIVIFIVDIFILIRLETYKHVYKNIEDIPHTEVAIILGASVFKNGNLSPVLIDRVNTAIKLYEAKKVDKILVTGDNSTLDYNEVSPVRFYLIDKGIAEKDIFLDHAGFDTYSSLYRARDIFKTKSITIVTQSFHLSRSVFIAKSLGLKSYGLSADNGRYKLKNYIREFLANGKAVINLVTGRKPKYLGDEIPIIVSSGE